MFAYSFGGSYRANRNSTQSKGLIGWWPFLDPQLVDRSGRGALMTTNGGSFEIGNLRNSYLFDDASTEYLQYDQALLLGAPATFSCWFKTNDVTILQNLVSIQDSSDPADWLGLSVDGTTAGDPVQAWDRGNVLVKVSTTTGAIVDTWHLATAVFRSSSNRSVYIDGGSRGDDLTTSVSHTVFDSTTIGRYSDSTPSSYMSGNIADVRIYNRAMSDAEVAQLYNPATRWELYEPVSTRFISIPAAAAASGGGMGDATMALGALQLLWGE